MMNKIIKAISLAVLFSTTTTGTVKATMPVPAPPQVQEKEKPQETTQITKDANELQDRFNRLTEEQKQEIFQMTGEIREKQHKLIDKYVEFGLLTQEEATALKEAMDKGMSK